MAQENYFSEQTKALKQLAKTIMTGETDSLRENANNKTPLGLDAIKFMDVEKLVDQLRAAKQFTNLGNFNTQCCVCYKKFKGQKGVIEHAQNTGHQNFSEIPN